MPLICRLENLGGVIDKTKMEFVLQNQKSRIKSYKSKEDHNKYNDSVDWDELLFNKHF